MIKKEVPIWEKSNLTLEEAAAYSGIGIHMVLATFVYASKFIIMSHKIGRFSIKTTKPLPLPW